jgi:hypothetical protein
VSRGGSPTRNRDAQKGLSPVARERLLALMARYGSSERLSVILRTSGPTLEKALDGVASSKVVVRLEAAIEKECAQW